MIKINKKWK